MARVVVDVMPKPEILDPQGQAVANGAAPPRLHRGRRGPPGQAVRAGGRRLRRRRDARQDRRRAAGQPRDRGRGPCAGWRRDREDRRHHLPRHAGRRRRRRGRCAASGAEAGRAVARRRGPARRRRGRRPRRLLLRRLPARRRDRPVRAGDAAGGRRGPAGHAGAGHLQRLPDAVRGRPAARRADPQREPALRLPRRVAAGGEHRHRVDLALRRRAPRSWCRSSTWRAATCADADTWTSWRARAGWCSATGDNPNGSRRRHRRRRRRRRPGGRPDAAPRARHRRADRAQRRRPRACSCPLSSRWWRHDASTERHRRHRRHTPLATPDHRAALPRAGPQGRRVRAHPGDPRPPADRRRTGHVLGDVERALLLQVVARCTALLRRNHHARRCGRRCWPVSARTPAWSTSATAGRSRSRRRVAQPPVLRGALPGRGDRCRRHRARHHGDGRPAARGDGPAAVRRGRRTPTPGGCCPAWSPGSAATATASACPTSAARWCSTRRYAGNPLVNALCVGAMRVEDLHLAHASGTGNKIILFGARTGLDGIGGVSVLASDTFSGDEGSGGRKKLPQRAGRRPVHREGADRVLPRAVRRADRWSASRTSAAPGCPAPPVRAGQRRGRRHARRAGPGSVARQGDDARRDPLQRVAGTHVRGRRARRRRRLPGGLPQVGRDRHRDRRGHRRRPAGDHLARRDRGRRAAAHRGARGPGLPPADRAPRRPGRAGRGRAGRPDPAEYRRADVRATLLRMVGVAEPGVAALGHPAVRPLRAGRHRAGAARRTRA